MRDFGTVRRRRLNPEPFAAPPWRLWSGRRKRHHRGAVHQKLRTRNDDLVALFQSALDRIVLPVVSPTAMGRCFAKDSPALVLGDINESLSTEASHGEHRNDGPRLVAQTTRAFTICACRRPRDRGWQLSPESLAKGCPPQGIRINLRLSSRSPALSFNSTGRPTLTSPERSVGTEMYASRSLFSTVVSTVFVDANPPRGPARRLKVPSNGALTVK